MHERKLTRREALRLAGGALGAPLWAPLLAGCGGRSGARLMPVPSGSTPPGVRAGPGVQPLGLGGERDGVLIVPGHTGPLPLVLMLHGAGGTGRRAAGLIRTAAEALGCAVLAPDARSRTWDAVTGEFGPDVHFLARALAAAEARCDLDPARRAVAGFSDGATYALALGRANGDRFSHALAFSPGFLLAAPAVGAPRIFVSHGRQDEVLPIARCSRVLVPRLRRDGYEVTYREFDGGHVVPPAIVGAGMDWFLEGLPTRAAFSLY
jgi:phospholipase/carboxylesterase